MFRKSAGTSCCSSPPADEILLWVWSPRAIRWVYGKHWEAESPVILSELISLSLWRPTSLDCQGWTQSTAMLLRWGEPLHWFNFWLPVAIFLLLSNVNHNMLAVYDAWQHKQSQSRKGALRGINSLNLQLHQRSSCIMAVGALGLLRCSCNVLGILINAGQ